MPAGQPLSADSWPATIGSSERDDDLPQTHAIRRRVRSNETNPSPDRCATHLPIHLRVPGFEILSELGRGGMGVVFLAKQVSLDRIVALKVIRDIFCATGEEWARFLAEAEAVASLHHPGIVQVYECGQADDIPFMALEYIEGGSLADHAAERALPPREAAAIVEQVARAVHHAHTRGTIHRDLKPENILLADDGRPMVSDFGLARRLQDAQQKTLTGTVLGTPGYMAPEQAAAQSSQIGPTTDVYGLGAILYRLLTGRPPFQAADYHVVLMQVLHESPAKPRSLNPQLPLDLETICMKCLRRDPRQRYASADELAADLERWRQGKPIIARPVGPLERGWKLIRRNPLIASLIAALVLLLVLGTTLSSLFAYWAHRSERRARFEERLASERADSEAKARRDADRARRGADHAHHKAKMAHREVQRRIDTVFRERGRAQEARTRLDRLFMLGTDRLSVAALREEWLRSAEAEETFAALTLLDRLIANDADHRSELLPQRAKFLRTSQERRANDPLVTLALAQQAILKPDLDSDRRHRLPLLSQIAESFDTSLAYRLLGASQIDAGAPEAAVASLERARARRPLDATPREELLLGLAHAHLGEKEKARAQLRIGLAWRARLERHEQQIDDREPLAALEMALLQARLEQLLAE